ncbi:type I-E CRISPR-associated protein Cse2/CasB [Lactiplantibacillus daowaiensis]|uniref:Type I-E CRISPR-associated protein Cse2/CasB n=1 Tax=Lactiplantibacillus daowaiensis TaxID=2559918 RepID=A0ABW1RZE3_9LACO|nr:type I-E CRISPR-associated protein Cse2/CasB [Lactiplantibacillus daowaiensis]
MVSEIERATTRIIKALYRDGSLDKKALYGLKNARDITSLQAQAVWHVMMANMQRDMLSTEGNLEPTAAEVAVFTAIQFYAIYQQGNSQFVYESYINEEGMPLFEALADLRQQRKQDSGNSQALDNRVKSLLASSNVKSIINELSHLIGILKSDEKLRKLDYGLLARDLFKLQGSYRQANQIRFLWGEQYFWESYADNQVEGEKA